MSERVTVIIGAGLPLNLDIPHNIIYPSTAKITDEVCKPYPDYSKYHNGKIPDTTIVSEFRDVLVNNYPCDIAQNKNINFEQIFHCLELYISYSYSWSKNCRNERMCPVFGPFTKPYIDFDPASISCIVKQYLLRIMDIVAAYNNYFSDEVNGKEKWLADFFRNLPLMDVFNFNYDTMFENILGEGGYEDGFVDTPKSADYKIFSPNKLLENPNGLSTINHLHGCITYFHPDDPNAHIQELRHEDWVKFPTFDIVRHKMECSVQSQPNTQGGETIYNGPIITGLNKTAKLNCVPFDFYHGNLLNSITRNHKLLIIGYSFGDIYCNNLIQRMNLIHGDRARVAIIDYWNVENREWDLRQYAYYNVCQDLGETLCMYSNTNSFEDAVATLRPLDRNCMMRSPSGKLMIGVGGFESAARHAQEIYDFLNS